VIGAEVEHHRGAARKVVESWGIAHLPVVIFLAAALILDRTLEYRGRRA
jgi:hypothetical protein